MLKQALLVDHPMDGPINTQLLSNENQKDLLLFVRTLHASLETKTILQHFAKELVKHISFDSITYVNNAIECKFHKGHTENKRYSYQLTIDKESLGELIITRSTAFDKQEVFVLEEILCFLVNPLKNAIDHYHALQAALHDPLTGLLNRGSLSQSLQREIKLSQRHHQTFSIMILDLDDFKKINDSHGHMVGDEVLKHCAKLINEQIRDADLAFRIGGEEFLILLSRSKMNGALKLAQRIREAMENSPCKVDSHNLTITTSIGLASFKAGDSKNDLISRADKALYQAKQQGKNQVCSQATGY